MCIHNHNHKHIYAQIINISATIQKNIYLIVHSNMVISVNINTTINLKNIVVEQAHETQT